MKNIYKHIAIIVTIINRSLLGNQLRIIFSLSFILLFPFLSFSQNDTTNIYGYNLFELSQLKIKSVTKVAQEVSEVPATMRIIDKKEIKENSYFTLDEALSSLPGFQFRNTLGYNSYVFLRGLPSQNNLILVLIDGVQINELNSGGFYSGGQYNLENVERIEVIYGPASVIYGTNAVSGVINIITKKDEGIEVSTLAGNFNTLNTNINYGFSKDDFGLRLSAMFKTSEKVNLREDNCDYNWTSQMENYEDDYSFDIKSWYRNTEAGINFQNKQTPVSTYYPSYNTEYQDYGTLWNILFLNSYLKHKHNFSKHLSISSSLYNRNATVRDNSIFKIVDTAQFRYYRPNYLFGFENVLNYTYLKNFRMTFGVMIEYERLSESYSITSSNSANEIPEVPEKPSMLSNKLLSLFLESEYKISKHLFVVGGVRYDNSSVYDQVLTPRASLLYSSDKIKSKLLYAEAFRAPKPWDYTNGMGNSDLMPEQTKSLELANSFYLNKNSKISLSIYKNIIDEAIVKEVFGEGDNYQWINKGRIETDGAEISAQYSVSKLNIYANYTYNFSYDKNKELIPEIAKHTANAGFTFRFHKYINLNLRANYFGKRKNPHFITVSNSHFVDPALIFNGVLSVLNFHNFDFQFITKNIFDKVYYHTSNRLIERYRQPQRTVLFKVTYKFI